MGRVKQNMPDQEQNLQNNTEKKWIKSHNPTFRPDLLFNKEDNPHVFHCFD